MDKNTLVIEIGKAFSKLVKEKYFPSLKKEDWEESEGEEKFVEFKFGQSQSSVDKETVHVLTNVLFFGKDYVYEQFSMGIKPSWKGDYIEFSFGYRAWETNRGLCKNIYSDFVVFLKDNNYDVLLTTAPAFLECFPDENFEFVPTGKKAKIITDTFTLLGAKANFGRIIYKENYYSVTNVNNLLLSWVDEEGKKAEKTLVEIV